VEKDVVEQKSNMNLLEKKVKLAEQRRFKADNEIRILKERVGVLMKISNVDMIDPMVLPYEINEAIPGTSLTGIEIISLPDDKIDEENPENDAGSH
jgi:hypothetical protein